MALYGRSGYNNVATRLFAEGRIPGPALEDGRVLFNSNFFTSMLLAKEHARLCHMAVAVFATAGTCYGIQFFWQFYTFIRAQICLSFFTKTKDFWDALPLAADMQIKEIL